MLFGQNLPWVDRKLPVSACSSVPSCSLSTTAAATARSADRRPVRCASPRFSRRSARCAERRSAGCQCHPRSDRESRCPDSPHRAGRLRNRSRNVSARSSACRGNWQRLVALSPPSAALPTWFRPVSSSRYRSSRRTRRPCSRRFGSSSPTQASRAPCRHGRCFGPRAFESRASASGARYSRASRRPVGFSCRHAHRPGRFQAASLPSRVSSSFQDKASFPRSARRPCPPFGSPPAALSGHHGFGPAVGGPVSAFRVGSPPVAGAPLDPGVVERVASTRRGPDVVQSASADRGFAAPLAAPNPSPTGVVIYPDDGATDRIYEGSLLNAVLQTQMSGELWGALQVMVNRHFHSRDRRRVLVPKGSILLGSAGAVSDPDQGRLAGPGTA